MKLTSQMDGTALLVRGKVWPREAIEPDAWTVEFRDTVPNSEGSAAIYANATGILEGKVGCEVLFENVNISPNKTP
jgi:hypothetical protein